MSTIATRTGEMLEVCAYTSEMGAAVSTEQESGVALVTGANRGIGREVARQLAERGYEVLLGARNAEQASAVAKELSASSGGRIVPLTLDVSAPQSIAAAAEQIGREPGRLDDQNAIDILRDLRQWRVAIALAQPQQNSSAQ